MIRRLFILGIFHLNVAFLGAFPAHDAVEIRPLTPLKARQFFAETAQNIRGISFGGQRLRVENREVLFSKKGGEIWAQLDNGQAFEIDDQRPFLTPIDGNFPLLPFDVLLPFFRWDQSQYEGPGSILGRQTHRFSVFCEGICPIAKVYVWIDAKFAYPLAWDAFDADGNLVRQFRVRSFGKDGEGQWNMKRLQFVDNQKHRHISIEVLDL